MRTFIAIELPERIRSDIRKLQHVFTSYRFDIRWVKPMNMHLTIRFLGDVDQSTLEVIHKVLSDTASLFPGFDLISQGVGVFPNIRRPRILWSGIAGQTDVLGAIHQSLSSALTRVGFASEKRPFRGHLTIGRIKKRLNQNQLAEALLNHQGYVSEGFAVKHLVLFKSELRPAGPVYTKLYEVPLSA